MSDPTEDLYKILDRAGLDGATLMNSRKSSASIINSIRTNIVRELKQYITEREIKITGDNK